MTERIIQEARSITNKISNETLSSFGYRERVQLERLIFLNLKQLMKQLGYDLHGLSNIHFESLKKAAKENGWPKDVINVMHEAFEFKIYIKDISSSNAYVRNDALLRLSPNLVQLIPLICNKFMNLITKMSKLS